jgi:hypothetical protein
MMSTASLFSADEGLELDNIVSTFFFNTCQLCPQPSEYRLHGLVMSASCTGELVLTVTGSVSEFYIQPMLPHIGDVDIMYYRTSDIAIPAGHSVPQQLSAEFGHHVRVNEIQDTRWPGYVYLKVSGEMTRTSRYDNYTILENKGEGEYLDAIDTVDAFLGHEPNSNMTSRYDDSRAVPCDFVPCIRCPVWPPQAADWPTRRRKYGWPDTATIAHIVNNGCDVVTLAQSLCKKDEPMWRLSFSRAETVLLNSWTPAQQIVYHMIRFFAQKELIVENSVSDEDKILCNYHIKTLMLWACELKPPEWWTGLSLVRICGKLLRQLTAWLEKTSCQQYFVTKCNLFYRKYNVSSIRLVLNRCKQFKLESLCMVCR